MKKFLIVLFLVIALIGSAFATEIIETQCQWTGDKVSLIFVDLDAGAGGAQLVTGVAGVLVGAFSVGADLASAKVAFFDSATGVTTTGEVFHSDYLGQTPVTLFPSNAVSRVGFLAMFGVPFTNGITLYGEQHIDLVLLYAIDD